MNLRFKKSKGFGTPHPGSLPLVRELEAKLRSGQLVMGQSSTWDYLESLTKAESWRLNNLKDRPNNSKAIAEIILLTVTLLGMELNQAEVSLTEEELIDRTQSLIVLCLIVLSSLKELIDAGLIDAQEIPKRLIDSDRSFGLQVLPGGMGDE